MDQVLYNTKKKNIGAYTATVLKYPYAIIVLRAKVDISGMKVLVCFCKLLTVFFKLGTQYGSKLTFWTYTKGLSKTCKCEWCQKALSHLFLTPLFP